MSGDLSSADVYKKQAAIQAVSYVHDGMVVGLGTGSTARFVVAELGRRVREEGLNIQAIPTSMSTKKQACEEGIPLITFADQSVLDIVIDGADEIELKTLNLIKGMGGALLWEKIVASTARQFVIVADTSKYVEHLGMRCPLPVEVVTFGWESTARKLSALGAQVTPRRSHDGSFFLTDENHFIMDCVFSPMIAPYTLADDILSIVGVVEHGLFLHMATTAIVGGENGVHVLKPSL
ncbi:MAG: ribose 5-phosphate isomerase A [Acetobacter sp.]|nr:ribose 5-phosphate isomerase A [Acetobacter sp.]